MNRRGFLGLFAVSTAGALVLPETFVFSPKPLAPEVNAFSVEDMTRAIALEMEKVQNEKGYRPTVAYEDQILLGDSLSGVKTLRRQHVAMRLRPRAEIETHGRCVRPIAESLTESIERHGITHLGSLHVPLGATRAAMVHTPRVALRGVNQYNFLDDCYDMRFEIIGG